MNPAETLPRAIAVETLTDTDDAIALSHEGRFLRRKRLTSQAGLSFLVDLPSAVDLRDGMALVLEDGRRVAVVAAPEPVLEVRGDLVRMAWHIGNRHTPCEITDGALYVRADPVLAEMLRGLGATVTERDRPFRPEGGAYGPARGFAHHHGPTHG